MLLLLAAADEKPLLEAADEVPRLEAKDPSAAWIRVSMVFMRPAMALSTACRTVLETIA